MVNNELKKESLDLIEEAKKRYPVGTCFFPAHINKKRDNTYCIITEDSNFVLRNFEQIVAIINDSNWVDSRLKQYGNTPFNRVVYERGKWAEIVSKPEEKIKEITEENKSLVGRYLKALIDYPNAGAVKKGEYGKIIDSNFADFPSQQNYSCGTAIINLNDSNPIYINKYELMPEGFNPNIETSIEYVKCIKGENNNIHNIVGKIYKVKSYNKNLEYLTLEDYDNTIHNINLNTTNPTNQTDYCIATKEEYDMQNQSKFEVGKWYKTSLNGSTYYGKFNSWNNNKFKASDAYLIRYVINHEFCDGYTWKLLTDLTEIQPYLPDGHVDKLPKELNYKELQDKAWEIYKNVKIGDKYINTRGDECVGYKNVCKSLATNKNSFIECGPGFLWEIQDGEELFAKLLPNDVVETKEVPEYVECIESITDCFTVGRIYTWPHPTDNDGKVRDIGVLNGGLWVFTSTTKEAYDRQQKKLEYPLTSNESFKINDLLIQAKERYPIGTKFYNAIPQHSNKIHIVTKCEVENYENNSNNIRIYASGGDDEKAVIFYANKWAKIILEKKEEWIPKVGDFVTIEDSTLLESGCQGCPKGTFIVVENVFKSKIAGLNYSNENTFIIKTDINHSKFWRISNIGVRKAEPHEIPKETTEIERLKNNWLIGDKVKLIDGYYKDMNEGHIGIITSIESNREFSVDNMTGCDINFWKKVSDTQLIGFNEPYEWTILNPRTPRNSYAIENPLKIKSTINRIKSELIKVKQLKINN